jgi:micrococcal nuclease
MYEYKCHTIRVVDGSTVDAQVDLGFNVLIRQRIKLFGVDSGDIKSNNESERNRAMDAKARLTELLGKEFICQTIMNKRGKVGRTLGKLFVEDENGTLTDINKKLIDEGISRHFGE